MSTEGACQRVGFPDSEILISGAATLRWEGSLGANPTRAVDKEETRSTARAEVRATEWRTGSEERTGSGGEAAGGVVEVGRREAETGARLSYWVEGGGG
jgi:hypothetical protein